MTIRRLPHELWTRYNDDYYLSNCGRWYSVRKDRLLRQFPNSSGYMRTTLIVDGQAKKVFTHIKVVELFGDCNGTRIATETLREAKLSIDHLDRNKKNNRQSNLELVTHQENCKRKFTPKEAL